ncbi:hypothetical protein [Schaalia sp. Marseille-Q2122]|uniref:hypothetical protein n=1 Tax=Schaalia sp. Marseille-Q2122 TaxID=2736604 RepID=UPI00158CFC13|nr:hypothetical protein [Schaalia sp. Marseille-Q2122]
MLDTTNYDKLGSLKDLSYSDHDVLVLKSGKDSVAALRQKLEDASAQMAHAMEGEALIAAQQSLSTLNEELAQQERLIDAFIGHHERARESMRRAIAAYDELPRRLVDRTTEQTLYAEDRVFLDGQYVTPEAYLAALREQANREREAAAAAALSAMDGEISDYTQALRDETGNVRTHPSSNTPPDASSLAPASALGAAGAAGLAASRRGIFGPIIPERRSGTEPRIGTPINPNGVYRRPPATGPGSRNEPVNDPQALRHLDLYRTPINPRMSSDGPIGGYLPAHVTDGADPRWSSQHSQPPAGSSRASISAGMLLGGGGAAALGRSTLLGTQGTAPTPGSGASAYGTAGFGPGSSSASGVSTASALSGLRAPGTSAAGVSPASGVAGMARSGITPGLTPGVAPGLAGTNVGAAGPGMGSAAGMNAPGVSSTAGAPGAPGVPGAYAPGAATSSSSDRQSGKSRVGYQVVRVRDDERRPIRLSEGAGAGDSASMKPMTFNEPDDRWE